MKQLIIIQCMIFLGCLSCQNQMDYGEVQEYIEEPKMDTPEYPLRDPQITSLNELEREWKQLDSLIDPQKAILGKWEQIAIGHDESSLVKYNYGSYWEFLSDSTGYIFIPKFSPPIDTTEGFIQHFTYTIDSVFLYRYNIEYADSGRSRYKFYKNNLVVFVDPDDRFKFDGDGYMPEIGIFYVTIFKKR